MTREEKIKAIEDIEAGVPAKFAFNKPMFLYRNIGETVWHTKETPDGEVLTEEERIKFLPSAICFENVSLQFPYEWL